MAEAPALAREKNAALLLTLVRWRRTGEAAEPGQERGSRLQVLVGGEGVAAAREIRRRAVDLSWGSSCLVRTRTRRGGGCPERGDVHTGVVGRRRCWEAGERCLRVRLLHLAAIHLIRNGLRIGRHSQRGGRVLLPR